MQNTSLSPQEASDLDKLHQWLITRGARYDSLKLAYINPSYRGVISTRSIKKRERVVFIPKECLITLQMCKEDPISRQVINDNAELSSPKHTFMAIFLMQHSRMPDSQWQFYLKLLPQQLSDFPINYSTQQLTQLLGSPLLMQIHQKVVDLKRDYDRVRLCSSAFNAYSFKQFCWARTIVGSRMFGVVIDGVKTDILAPFADMLNHRLPKQCSWNYLQEEKGFAIESLCDIQQGVEVCDSYGRKCNSRYLLNYGFILTPNPQNLVYFRVNLEQGQFATKKLEMIKRNEGGKVLRASQNLNDHNFFETMGFLRFKNIIQVNQLAVLEKISRIKITNEPYLPQKTPPITLQLEKAVWKNLKNLCEQNLKSYPTSLQYDLQLLKQPLSANMKNVVTIRSDEKALYMRLINICQEVLSTLLLGYLQAYQQAVRVNKPWSAYLIKILSIMPHQQRKDLPEIKGNSEQQVGKSSEEQQLAND